MPKPNPLEELARLRAPKVVTKLPASEDFTQPIVENPFRQSTQPAGDPPPPPVFDTTTKAVERQTIRRFDLNDLPSMGVKIYPHLKRLYPHLNERMYSGWIRSCINDNSCHFIRTERTVCLAFMAFRPMNPVCFVEVKFLDGHQDDFEVIYTDLKNWGDALGASHIEQEQYDPEDLAKYLPGLRLEERVVGRVFLK